MAALIDVASRCAAAPGHTAQPFKPNNTAGRYLLEAWSKKIPITLKQSVNTISPLYARKKGYAKKDDAITLASELKEGDLVFLDPPYSGVHYSRFYHVLETLTANKTVTVSGKGRYPPRMERPQSKYSVQTRSENALRELLLELSRSGCSVMVTFPAESTSNGLSGTIVEQLAAEFFEIKSLKISSRFSTLGGNRKNRDARKPADELILTLSPRG